MGLLRSKRRTSKALGRALSPSGIVNRLGVQAKEDLRDGWINDPP